MTIRTCWNEFKAIKCRACMKVHFINRKTGKLLGQDDKQGLPLGGEARDRSPLK
jgi:hypothetical protein